MSDAEKPSGVFGIPGFRAFWLGETVSAFGVHVTTIALQVLVVVTLSGTATDVGLVNAARWLPYLLFGFVLGAVVDRQARKPILVSTDFGRAALLAGLPALWLLGWLNPATLLAFVAVFGVLSLLNDAASQSFLPRLAPPRELLAANARLDQGAAAAQMAGPLLGGALVTALSAPLAVLANCATYVFSAIAVLRIRITEPPAPARTKKTHILREIGEGLSFIYRHRMMAPLALSTHVWFLFNAAAGAAYVPFVLLGLGLSAFDLGLTLACAGAAALLGSFIAARAGERLGAGGAILMTRVLYPIAWIPIALAPAASGPLTIGLLGLGQAIVGFSMGASNANEMAFRQASTPDVLQGRVNTSMRSINRAMIVIGAPLGGALADAIGYRLTIWIAIVGFVLAAMVLWPARGARHA